MERVCGKSKWLWMIVKPMKTMMGSKLEDEPPPTCVRVANHALCKKEHWYGNSEDHDQIADFLLARFFVGLMFAGWFKCAALIWAPSSEFVSSSIPSWQISTAHAQPFRGARDMAFCLKVPLDSLLVWASSEGSGETARMRRLAWTFAARIGDKYQIRLTRSI